MQNLRVNCAFFQVAFHGFVVHFHDAFDECLVHAFNGGKIGFTLIVIKAVNHVGAVFIWQIKREHFIAKSLAQFNQKLRQVDPGLIKFIDDDHAAKITFFGPLHHAACHQFNALGGIDDYAHGFNGV